MSEGRLFLSCRGARLPAVAIGAEGILVLGRAQFPGIAGADVSATHARIDVLGAGRVLLRDISAGCGTFVREAGAWREVQREELALPFELRLGTSVECSLSRIEHAGLAPRIASQPVGRSRAAMQLRLDACAPTPRLRLRCQAAEVELPLGDALDVRLFDRLLATRIADGLGVADLTCALALVPLLDPSGWPELAQRYPGLTLDSGVRMPGGAVLVAGEYPRSLLSHPVARRHLVTGLHHRIHHWGRELDAAGRQLAAATGRVVAPHRFTLEIRRKPAGHHLYRLESDWMITAVERVGLRA